MWYFSIKETKELFILSFLCLMLSLSNYSLIDGISLLK